MSMPFSLLMFLYSSGRIAPAMATRLRSAFRFWVQGVLLGFWLMAVSPAVAEEMAFHLSGFGTLAATRTSDDRIGYRQSFQPLSEAGDWAFNTDSNLGVQLEAVFNPSLSAVVQVIHMRRDEGHFQPEVEWAYLDYDISSNWELRLGRVLTPLFMESEYRFVHYALLPVRPSNQVYSLVAISHHDGLNVTYRTSLGEGLFSLTGYIGQTGQERPKDSQGRDFRYEVERLYGAALTWENDRYLLRLGYTDVEDAYIAGSQTNILFRPLLPLLRDTPATTCPNCAAEADKIDGTLNGANARLFNAGVQGRWEPWVVSAEYFTFSNEGVSQNTKGWVVTLARRFGDWTPYISASETSTHSNNAPSLPTGVNPLFDGYNILLLSQKTDRQAIALGVRWDLADSLALKAEVEHYRLDSALGQPANFPAPPAGVPHSQHFNLFTLALDFVF